MVIYSNVPVVWDFLSVDVFVLPAVFTFYCALLLLVIIIIIIINSIVVYCVYEFVCLFFCFCFFMNQYGLIQTNCNHC